MSGEPMGQSPAEKSIYEQEQKKVLDALFWSLRNLPNHVQIVPLAPMVNKVERKQRKTGRVEHHPSGAASVEIERYGALIVHVPEQVANELKCGPDHMPLFLLVRVSREAMDRFDSPIVAPTEH